MAYIILTKKKSGGRYEKAGPYKFKTKSEAIRMAKRGLGEERENYDITTRKVKD